MWFFRLDETTTVSASHTGSKSAPNGRRKSAASNRIRLTSGVGPSSAKTRAPAILTTTSRRKREQQSENLQIAITELLNHFSHRNLDAIVRVIKMTLEKLRKRITSTLSYGMNEKLKIINWNNENI